MGSIYGLYDPTSGVLRYIGKTKNDPYDRLYGHICNANSKGKTHLCNWLRSISVLPKLKVLRRVSYAALNAAEKSLIVWHRQRGTPLVNTTVGGDGGDTHPGRSMTQETKDAIGRANKGKKKPWLSQRNVENPPFLGRKHSEETKKKMSAKAAGRRHQELSTYNKLPEVREARRVAAVLQWKTKREKMLAAIRDYWR